MARMAAARRRQAALQPLLVLPGDPGGFRCLEYDGRSLAHHWRGLAPGTGSARAEFVERPASPTSSLASSGSAGTAACRERLAKGVCHHLCNGSDVVKTAAMQAMLESVPSHEDWPPEPRPRGSWHCKLQTTQHKHGEGRRLLPPLVLAAAPGSSPPV